MRRAPNYLKSMWLLASLIVASTPALGQWSSDPTQNLPIVQASGRQSSVVSVTGTDGSLWVAWESSQNGNQDIYLARYDAEGKLQSTPGGIQVTTDPADQTQPHLEPIYSGNSVYLSWKDESTDTGEIVVARYLSSGSQDFRTTLAAPGTQELPQSVSTPFGLIVFWVDRNPPTSLHVQDVGFVTGSIDGPPGGLVITGSLYDASPDYVTEQLHSNAWAVAWPDQRGADVDIYAISGPSATLALNTEAPVCVAAGDQTALAQTLTGTSDSWVLAWQDERGSSTDIYAQRYNSSLLTSPVWAVDGIGVETTTSDEDFPVVVGDDAGGAFFVSERFDLETSYVDAGGTIVSTGFLNTGSVSDFRAASDGSGNAILVWSEFAANGRDVFAQVLDPSNINGALSQRLEVSVAVDDQADGFGELSVTSDPTGGGVFAVWQDERGGSSSDDIYGQNILSRGVIGNLRPFIAEVIDHPQDQGGQVVVSWDRSATDILAELEIVEYSLWRRFSGNVKRGSEKIEWVQDVDARELLATTGWEHLSDTRALTFLQYSDMAPTYYDDTGGGEEATQYLVIAHTTTPAIFYSSDVVSGISVDNLSPGAPKNLTGMGDGASNDLTWEASGVDDEDLLQYAVYRSETLPVVVEASNLVGTSVTPDFTDTSGMTGTEYHYVVTGIDVHTNEGEPSMSTTISPATSAPVGFGPALQLLGSSPNPSTGPTSLRFALGASADVQLELFDLAGRRILSQRMGSQTAGQHAFVFDGRDAQGRTLASGTYLYRISAAGHTSTGRMVIAR